MRTIKFRGQFVYTNALKGQFDWVYGDLVHYPEHIGKHKIICKGGSQFEVLASTVGQFTGLHDCKGKEIYEGDIIRSSNGVLHSIEFDNSTACFTAVRILNSKVDMRHGLSTYKIEQYMSEVIGNIYDNPELLKGGEA